MTTDQLPKLIKAQPFPPFVIRTADGHEVEVGLGIANGQKPTLVGGLPHTRSS